MKRIVKTMEVTLATFNIASGRIPDTDKINQLLIEQQIDIIGLQEVDCYTSRNAKNLAKEIGNETYPFQLFGEAMPFETGKYGNAILSKYPVENYREHKFSIYGEEPRIAQVAQIYLVNNRVITICNTHLSFESIDLRQKQSAEILQTMKKFGGKYQVIVGDFNMDQSEEEWALYKKEYQLANGKNGTWINTFHEQNVEMKKYSIDNILVSSTIDLVEVTLIETELSDHHLLKVKIRINEGESV